jgi:hypothetical protein
MHRLTIEQKENFFSYAYFSKEMPLVEWLDSFNLAINEQLYN